MKGLDDYRDEANRLLLQTQADLNDGPAETPVFDPTTFKSILSIAQVATTESDMGARIGVAQALEQRCLTVLTNISNTVAALQAYQTECTNPSAMEHNA